MAVLEEKQEATQGKRFLKTAAEYRATLQDGRDVRYQGGTH